jgi:hypothetical protein
MNNPQKAAPIGIEACETFTAYGNTAQSLSSLLSAKVALQAMPVLGQDGGDLVPLASALGYDETVPPRWAAQLDQLAALIPNEAWGSAKFPVYVTSSNFDVGSLYAYGKTQDERFLEIGTPAKCLNYLRTRYGWGRNTLALSHACVSAHVGIDIATRSINLGVAEKALIFSFDYISPFVAGGFHALKILNQQFPAPYQDRATGSIGLGDGCGFVVLSQAKTAARIEDNFLYNEMYHFTANDPTGSGFRMATEWLESVAKNRSIWIKGHGTGTLEAAHLEAEAFLSKFPSSPLVSWKGGLGHTLGSCGIVELAITLEAIRKGIAPGTVGSLRPTISDNVALDSFEIKDYEAVALFSNAFGGAHAGCLISYD